MDGEKNPKNPCEGVDKIDQEIDDEIAREETRTREREEGIRKDDEEFEATRKRYEELGILEPEGGKAAGEKEEGREIILDLGSDEDAEQMVDQGERQLQADEIREDRRRRPYEKKKEVLFAELNSRLEGALAFDDLVEIEKEFRKRYEEIGYYDKRTCGAQIRLEISKRFEQLMNDKLRSEGFDAVKVTGKRY